jgi:hypothetical protein
MFLLYNYHSHFPGSVRALYTLDRTTSCLAVFHYNAQSILAIEVRGLSRKGRL